MLSKKFRLQKNKEYERVFKKTKPVFEQNLSARFLHRGEEETRFGFIISNKVDKRSSRRNALKRQLRAIVADLKEIAPGYDVVVAVKKDFPFPYNQAEIKKQFTALLRRGNILPK